MSAASPWRDQRGRGTLLDTTNGGLIPRIANACAPICLAGLIGAQAVDAAQPSFAASDADQSQSTHTFAHPLLNNAALASIPSAPSVNARSQTSGSSASTGDLFNGLVLRSAIEAADALPSSSPQPRAGGSPATGTTGAGASGGVQRPQLPPLPTRFAPLQELKLPEYQRVTLKNGLRVFLMEDHEVRGGGGAWTLGHH